MLEAVAQRASAIWCLGIAFKRGKGTDKKDISTEFEQGRVYTDLLREDNYWKALVDEVAGLIGSSSRGSEVQQLLASIHAEIKQFGSIKTEPGILKGASARPLLDEVTNQFPTHERVLGQERTQELKQATVQLTTLLVKAWLKREPLPKDHLQWVKNVCGVFGMTAEQKDISSALVEYQSANTVERLRVAATAAMTSVNEVSFFQSSYEATVSVQKDDDTWKRICEGFSNLLDQFAERATTPTSTGEFESLGHIHHHSLKG